MCGCGNPRYNPAFSLQNPVGQHQFRFAVPHEVLCPAVTHWMALWWTQTSVSPCI